MHARIYNISFLHASMEYIDCAPGYAHIFINSCSDCNWIIFGDGETVSSFLILFQPFIILKYFITANPAKYFMIWKLTRNARVLRCMEWWKD